MAGTGQRIRTAVTEMDEMYSRRLLRYIFYIILRARGPKYLKSTIWRNRKQLTLSERIIEGQGTVYCSPLFLLSRGLLPNQIVQLYISYETNTGVSKQTVRLLRICPLTSLKSDEFTIGTDDKYNLFNREIVKNIKLDLRHFRSLNNRQLQTADTIRLAPVKSTDTKNGLDYSEALKDLLNYPRIVYKRDMITLKIQDPLKEKETTVCFRVDCSEDFAVVDKSCSIFETSPLNSHFPAKGPTVTLLATMAKQLERIINVVNAYEKVSEDCLVLHLSGSSGSGKRLLAKKLASMTYQNFLEVNCYDIWSEVPVQAESKLKNSFDKAQSINPCVLYFSNADVLGFDPNSNEIDPRVIACFKSSVEKPNGITVIVSSNTDKAAHLSPSLTSQFLYSFSIDVPNETDRLEFFSKKFPSDAAMMAARNTSGFVLSELFSLCHDVSFYHLSNPSASINSSIEWAIDMRNSSFADAIGAPKIPTVSWDDVGGLEETKQLVIESIEANLHSGSSILKRSGIILYGPPGCGKTLIAKAVASEFKVAFLSVKGPELLNKYIGQSEENLRKVFERARQASPCVIFFDELDSLAPNRGRSGDSGGVMDRIVSQLLSEMDTLHSSSEEKVFVMGATNRRDLLDQSLLTPGRFDKVVHISPGTSVEAKNKILQAVSRKLKLAEDVDLKKVATDCPTVMSGAELYSVVSTAAMAAVREQVKLIESGQLKLSDATVSVGAKHLQEALATAVERQNLQERENGLL